MKNISCKEVLKAKSSAPFISIIGLYFIVFFLLHIICLIHAIKVLGGMSDLLLGEQSVEWEEQLRMIAATFNPNVGLMGMIQFYLAYIIPLVVTVAFSFILANEWEYKTIRIETVYKDKWATFFAGLRFAVFFTYALVLLTAYANKILNLFIWGYLTRRCRALTTISIANSDIKTYIMLFFAIILATVLYYTLAYLLTYCFGTNIPFIILIVGNAIKNDLWRYLPVTIYKTILDNILINNKDNNILFYLFNPSAIENQKNILYGSVHPVLCIYFYLVMCAFVLMGIFRKKIV